MRNKKIILSLFIVLLLSSLVFLYFNENDGRKQYEKFLLQEYQKLPFRSIDELKELPEETRPDLAAIQNYFMTIDPNLKRVPVERLKAAFSQTTSINELKNSHTFGSDMVWEEVPSNMAGRTRAFMIDPNDTSGNKAWAGSVTGGLWVNDNFKSETSAWQAVDDFWSNLVISCIVSDPNNPNVFYVGTGEAQTAFTIYRESSGIGAGIWKTTDGGLHWELIPSTENFKYITDIGIRDEEGSSVIYACVTSGVYKGANHQSLPSDGLYRSDDNGDSWEQVLPELSGSNKPFAPADIEIGADGRIYIGTMRNLDEEGGGRILYSDEGISGSWTIWDNYVSIIENSVTYNIPGRVMIACAPSNPDIVYALLDVAWVNPNNGFKHSQGQYILKSSRKGEIWYNVTIPNDGNYYWATIGWHALAAAVDPNDENTVFVGGLDTYKSTDGGNNWHKISDWTGMYAGETNNYIHADIHKILFLNNSSDELIVATDGGIFYTSDATAYQPAFEQKNNNYNSLQFYTCAIDPRAGYNIFLGGLQDNGTIKYSGTPINYFSRIDGGDGAFCFIDQDEPGIQISSIYYNRYYFFNNSVNAVSSAGNFSGTGIFINPVDYDNRLNTLYANATTFLGQNKNYLVRISGIPNNPAEELIRITTDVEVPFSHILVSPHSPSNSSTLYAGTQSGRLFKIENANTNPVSTEIGSPDFPSGNISCVAVGGSEDTLLVTFSNYGVPSVWQTYNGGQSWKNKEGNLPDMPVRWVLYHPDDASIAIIATEVGVWSTNGLAEETTEWIPVIEGLANVRVDMLQMRASDKTLLAATHGRGLMSTVLSPVGWNDYEYSSELLEVYPNPTSGLIHLNIDHIQAQKLQLKLYDPGGKLIWSEAEINISGSYTKTFDLASYPKGVYILQLFIDEKRIIKKVIHK